jgi:hypothetical protein
MSDMAHPSPYRHRVGLAALLFGASAAPIFWLGQLILGFAVTAFVCYPGDHPAPLAAAPLLGRALIGFDTIALLACFAGGAVSWWCWRQTAEEKRGGPRHALHTGEGRARFLALWGIISSLWFFAAILFNTIASVTVPPCLN